MPVYSGAARELSGQLPRRCRFCGSPLDQGQLICPCRRLAVSQVRRRTRPARVEVTRIQAEGLLKEYIITRNDIDGALNCTCPSFEEQNNDELHGEGIRKSRSASASTSAAARRGSPRVDRKVRDLKRKTAESSFRRRSRRRPCSTRSR